MSREDPKWPAAGTHASLIKDGCRTQTQERWSRGERRRRWSEESSSRPSAPLIRAANKEQIELLMMGSRVPIDEPVKKQPYDHSHTRDNTLANNVS